MERHEIGGLRWQVVAASRINERFGLELLYLMVQVGIKLRQVKKLWNAPRNLRLLEAPRSTLRK